MADLFDKLHGVLALAAAFDAGVERPLETVFERMLGPTVAEIQGRRTLVFGSNNYFGLTWHPDDQGTLRHQKQSTSARLPQTGESGSQE